VSPLRHFSLFLVCSAFVAGVLVVASSWNFSSPDGGASLSFSNAQNFWSAVGEVFGVPARLVNMSPGVASLILLICFWASLLHCCCYGGYLFLRRIFRN